MFVATELECPGRSCDASMGHRTALSFRSDKIRPVRIASRRSVVQASLADRVVFAEVRLPA